jgi:hypothetical protein
MGYARQPGVFGLERARIQVEIKDAGRFDKDIALNGPL